MPAISIENVQLSNGASSFMFSTSPVAVGVQLTVQVKVDNPNPIPVDLTQITTKGDWILPNGQSQTVAVGKTDRVMIQSSGVTRFPIQMVLYHSAPGDMNSLAQDDILRNLLDSCGITNNSQGVKTPINLRYSVSLNVALISFTGYVPTFENTVQIACPLAAMNIPQDFLNAVQSIINNF